MYLPFLCLCFRMVGDEYAVQVVNLVLANSRQQAVGFQAVPFAADVVIDNFNALGALDGPLQVGKRQTALFYHDRIFTLVDDFRVDEHG